MGGIKKGLTDREKYKYNEMDKIVLTDHTGEEINKKVK